MRLLFTILTLWCLAISGTAQSYRNEWIDYNKTYYKFPVRETRIYRISKAVLTAAGLGNIPAEQFQLWRNGEEVPLYTTQSTGPLANDGFIEFLGRMQDGKPDAELFDKPESQVLYDLSYFSDTAWHYLTVNPAGNNKRITSALNNAATTTLTPDQYYIHEQRYYQYYTWNYGEAMTLPGITDNEYPERPVLRSSLLNGGEGWTGQPFNNWFPLTLNATNLQYFPGVGNIEFSYSVSGNYSRYRNIQIFMNDSLVVSKYTPFYTMSRDTVRNLSGSVIKGDAIRLKFSSDNDFYWENCLINVFALKYPRRFSFQNNGFAEFNLAANSRGNFLKVGGFRSDNQTTILYDLTNLKRYTATPKADSSFFAIDASTNNRNIVISNQVSFLRQVTVLTKRNFVSPANTPADYLIITNNILRPSSGSDNIEEYRKYRSSPEGGAFNARIFDIDDLAEQFAFGLRKHPLAIRNFLQFALKQFSTKPKYLFLVGKGTNFESFRATGDFAGKEIIGAVPTFGTPCSDNLLASKSNANPIPEVPIGRLSAVSNAEVGIYLQKVKLYEALLNKPVKTPQDLAWNKRFVHLTGSASSDYEKNAFTRTFIMPYSGLVRNSGFNLAFTIDTLPYTFDTRYFPTEMAKLQNVLDSGIGVLSFFGHSSTSSIDFGLKPPNQYPPANGKYYIAVANGCRAGNVFEFSTNRLQSTSTSISDDYIFANDKGAINFISNSDIGAIVFMYQVSNKWYSEMLDNSAGRSIGQIQKSTITNAILAFPGEKRILSQTEQSILSGDPAITPFPSDKPDYAISKTDISITPADPNSSNDAVWLKAKFYNLGKGNNDTVLVELKRKLPTGEEQIIVRKNLNRLNYLDSVEVKMSLRGLFEAGANQIIATADVNNSKAEMSEANNTAVLDFTLNTTAALPVFPYDLSIVNAAPKLTASTANPIATAAPYRFQVDTSKKFNSPLLRTFDTTTLGGAISVIPTLNWRNNTVYYWRVSPLNAGIANQWQNASILYSTNIGKGYNQSHYFQHLQSSLNELYVDSTSRTFNFADNLQHLFLVQGIYNTSGTEGSHFSVSENGIRRIANACLGQSIIFNVFDPITFKPWDNTNKSRFGSAGTCSYETALNFEFKYFNHANRKLIMDFLDSIPKGTIVAARLVLDPPYDSANVQYWKRDTLIYGKGKSLYHALVRQGFANLDSLNKPKTFVFVFKKDDTVSFKPRYRLSDGVYDRLNESVFVGTTDTAGLVTSPLLGPSSQWQQLIWDNAPAPGATNPAKTILRIFGVRPDSSKVQLDSLPTAQSSFDISKYPASQYPFLQLQMQTEDNKTAKPTQLNFWRATYAPVADGALSGKDYLLWNTKTLLAVRDSVKLGLAFKNVSDYPLAATTYVIKLGRSQGNEQVVATGTLRALAANDTAIIRYQAPSDSLNGKYYLKVEVNGNRNPLEQTYFNNSVYLPFAVDTSLMPVELLSFKAIPAANKIVTSWNVDFEVKVDRYEVLYGTDSTNMQVILTASPANIGQSASYSRDHLTPVIGNNYYRLRIIDKNGKATVTPAIIVEVALKGFDAQPSLTNNIGIVWNTTNEIKFDKFDMAYSTDKINWKVIANKTASNSGAAITNYSATHSAPILGINYYKLNYSDQYGKTYNSIVDSVNINFGTFGATVNGSSVNLKWDFINEINIKDFQVEESDDSLSFASIQQQNPTRNGSGTATYSIDRTGLSFGYHYYRIKVTDNSGNVAYTPVRRVFVGDASIIMVYPNPFTNEIRVVTGDLTNLWSLQLFDATGRLFINKTGIGPVKINTAFLAKGVYIMVMQKGDKKQNWKLQKR